MDADAESLPSIDLAAIYGDGWEERSLPSLPDSPSDQDIDDMDIDAATALVSDSQATVSQIRRARRRILRQFPYRSAALRSSQGTVAQNDARGATRSRRES